MTLSEAKKLYKEYLCRYKDGMISMNWKEYYRYHKLLNEFSERKKEIEIPAERLEIINAHRVLDSDYNWIKVKRQKPPKE